MQLKRLLIVLAICVLMAAPVWAAPSVSGVTGTVTDGQAITITGSSFGTGPNIVFFDDFEGGTNGATLSTGAGSAKVGTWNRIDIPNVAYSNSAHVSGSLALMSSPNTGDGMGGRGVVTFTSAQKLFVSYWARTDAWPNNGSGTNWKLVWPMNSCCSDHDISLPTILWTSTVSSITAGNSINGYVDYINEALVGGLNTWFRVWSYVDSNSPGTVFLWHLNASTPVTQGINHTGITAANSGNWFSGGGFSMMNVPGNVEIATSPHPLYDDVYIATGDNAMARVEIGNASTYAACTNLAIITPTSWSASSIAATVRSGSFAANASAYLYVIDSSNTISSGYPITFGAGGGGDTTPPVMSSPLPSGVQTCTGTPQTITLQLTTDEAATCKYSVSDATYANMANTYSTGTGTTSHSQSLSLACGASYTYYSRCMDTTGNVDASSATHSFSISSAGTSGPGYRVNHCRVNGYKF